MVNFELFIDEFNKFMSINPHSEQTCILGDFNIHLLKISSNHRYDIFFNILLADGYLSCITLPIRIDRTFTLIDNIYATSNFNNHCAGILTNKIYDQQMIFVILI